MNVFTKIFVTFAIAMALLIACAPAPTPIPTPLPPTVAPPSAPTSVPPTTAPTTAPTVAQPTAARTATAVVANGPLTVFAAASLTASFGDIGKAFEAANPGTKVTFNFAGSQALRTQIEQGAKPDVFASADTVNMEPLKTAGLVVGYTPIFTRNRLVVIAPKDNPAGVKTLKDLTKPGLKLDVADASVPVGNYMLQSLDKLSADATYGAGFKTQVLSRVVSKENDVKQVVSKVSLGEADAGVVYTTDAQAAIDKLVTIEIPDQFNVIAVYPIAVAKTSANAPLAQKFIDYVLGADGQAVMKKYGFAGKPGN